MKAVFATFFEDLTKRGLEWFGLYYGEYYGICVDNEDPEEQGRIKVKVPAVTGDGIGGWAWPKSAWSGKDSGFFVVPDVGDTVTVSFTNGNPSYPRYTGGNWPKVGGSNNFTPAGYVDGRPVIRLLRTKSGHELAFCDQTDDRYCHFVWNDPDGDKTTSIAIDKNGSVKVENHIGGILEMTALEDDGDYNKMVDSRGNEILQDKNGTTIKDSNGNEVVFGDNLVTVNGAKNFSVNGDEMDLKLSLLKVAEATESSIRGTTFFNWFVNTFLPHYMTHIHGTGVGPSGPFTVPLQPQPTEQQMLTDKVKIP